jgi:hypothetical protein
MTNVVKTVEIECPTCNEGLALKLVSLAYLRGQRLTRKDAAVAARSYGLAAHVGGCHVAIHVATAEGLIDPACPQRFAIITGTGPDWE